MNAQTKGEARMHLLPMSHDGWERERPEGGDERMPQAMQPAALSLLLYAHRRTQPTNAKGKGCRGGVGKTRLRTEAAAGETALETLPELTHWPIAPAWLHASILASFLLPLMLPPIYRGRLHGNEAAGLLRILDSSQNLGRKEAQQQILLRFLVQIIQKQNAPVVAATEAAAPPFLLS